MRETSFIKELYTEDCGFTMSVRPSACPSFHFDGIGRNILIFHTKKGSGKLIFGIDVTKWCMFRNTW